MPVDILSVQGFAFFMVVMATGYSYVEIFMGEHYPLRASMTRYNASIFDRLMHYVLAGVVINVLFLIFFVVAGLWRGLLANFNITGKLAEALMDGPGPAADSIQFVVASVAYFGVVTWAPTAVLGTLWVWRKLNALAFRVARLTPVDALSPAVPKAAGSEARPASAEPEPA